MPVDRDACLAHAASGHVLVVSEFDGERDYEIEHPSDCPTSEWDPGFDNCPPVLCYECGVGDLWSTAGSEIVPDVGALAPGRYPVRVHTEHTPSTPFNGGEEWDAWIEVVQENDLTTDESAITLRLSR